MLSYEFYWKDEMGKVHLIGILPERRSDKDRITNDSIMNWVRKVIGNNHIGNNIYFSQVKID